VQIVRGMMQRPVGAEIYRSLWRRKTAVFLLAFVALYCLTLADVHTFDAISYASFAQTPVSQQDLMIFLHPHHLAYHVLSKALYAFWQMWGWAGGSLLPFQILSVALSFLGLAVFYRITSRLTKSSVALVVTALLALSHRYWLFSVDVEVYMLSLSFLILTMYYTLELQKHVSLRAGLVVGSLLGGAILAHQTNVLFLPIIALAVMTSKSAALRQRIRVLLTLSVLAAVIVLIPYVISILVLRLDSWQAIVYWLTFYAHMDRWGGFHPKTLSMTVTGLRDAFIALSGGVPWQYSLLILVPLLVWFWQGYRANRRVAGLCLLWLALYGTFFAWWSPGGEFWITILPPSFLLLALAMNSLSPRPMKVGLALLLLCAPLYGFSNWRIGVSAPERQVVIGGTKSALAIAACMEPGERVITTTTLYPLLSYYGRVRPVSLELLFYNAEMRQPGAVREKALADLAQVIEDAIDEQQEIFVTGEALEGTPLSAKFGVGAAEIQDVLAPYRQTATSCSYVAGYGPGQPSFLVYRIERKPDQ
jgi:hypothetical protein